MYSWYGIAASIDQLAAEEDDDDEDGSCNLDSEDADDYWDWLTVLKFTYTFYSLGKSLSYKIFCRSEFSRDAMVWMVMVLPELGSTLSKYPTYLNLSEMDFLVSQPLLFSYKLAKNYCVFVDEDHGEYVRVIGYFV